MVYTLGVLGSSSRSLALGTRRQGRHPDFGGTETGDHERKEEGFYGVSNVALYGGTFHSNFNFRRVCLESAIWWECHRVLHNIFQTAVTNLLSIHWNMATVGTVNMIASIRQVLKLTPICPHNDSKCTEIRDNPQITVITSAVLVRQAKYIHTTQPACNLASCILHVKYLFS